MIFYNFYFDALELVKLVHSYPTDPIFYIPSYDLNILVTLVISGMGKNRELGMLKSN
jgi:hypothetical protein